ncbi:ribosomal RNA small subunit methyltransferase E [Peptoclostridium acidaminophilum DSM 3953]|uniref:Ribosomal RNA small subunit methyltransferase E n=1 Tax=Peptoclostridium acidaminophilum DSM 3953 TaxID=1286171 RepID=W8T4P9_PEPAC|nr:16S rRNA (uracil(1498)-N(3))-methyltransferase [Peptoclostridium acidaminophilum]AHM56734.1 ribosomal RNA small subunit methyltransferase E [Peptoclostridium acidaminophilum DSM 3953]
MDRFFADNIDYENGICSISDEEEVKHISKVLRLKEGEKLEICDGRQREFICQISSISKKEVQLELLEEIHVQREPGLSVTIYQGLPKAQKFELIVQKLTEIGVSRIVPLETARSIVKLDSKSELKKADRWEKIILGAAKQSKRGVLPSLEQPMSIAQAINDIERNDVNIVPYENERANPIGSVLRNLEERPESIGIFIGPEGGFEEFEIEMLSAKGVIPVTLGNRILRTETAAIVSSAIVLYELSDLGGVV